jgi:hypothetical protein
MEDGDVARRRGSFWRRFQTLAVESRRATEASDHVPTATLGHQWGGEPRTERAREAASYRVPTTAQRQVGDATRQAGPTLASEPLTREPHTSVVSNFQKSSKISLHTRKIDTR